MTRRAPAVAAASCAAAFVVLAVLVARGTLDRLDQWSVSHLMPWLSPVPGRASWFERLAVPGTTGTFGGTLVHLCAYPASVAASLLLVSLAAAALARRGRPLAAAAWLAAWLAANVVEVAGKAIVVRGALFTHGNHIAAFDQSYPSGHSLRAVVLAAALAFTWRAARPALVWAAAMPVVLVALGWHTPSDAAGGVLAGVPLALAAAYAATSAVRWTTSPSTTVSSTGSDGSSSGSAATGSSANAVRSAR